MNLLTLISKKMGSLSKARRTDLYSKRQPERDDYDGGYNSIYIK